MNRVVEQVWSGESESAPGVEHVLPTGAMHLVIRIDSEPLVLVTHGRISDAVVRG